MLKIILIIIKRPKYAIVGLLGFVAFAILTHYLTVVNVYQKSILVFADMNGGVYTVLTFGGNVVLSFLLGLYLALMMFRFDLSKRVTSKEGGAGLGGLSLGVVSAGCPSCGVPLLGLFGFPLALFSLPFRGLEIKIFSIAILMLAIWLIYKNTLKSLGCKINK